MHLLGTHLNRGHNKGRLAGRSASTASNPPPCVYHTIIEQEQLLTKKKKTAQLTELLQMTLYTTTDLTEGSHHPHSTLATWFNNSIWKCWWEGRLFLL